MPAPCTLAILRRQSFARTALLVSSPAAGSICLKTADLQARNRFPTSRTISPSTTKVGPNPGERAQQAFDTSLATWTPVANPVDGFLEPANKPLRARRRLNPSQAGVLVVCSMPMVGQS